MFKPQQCLGKLAALNNEEEMLFHLALKDYLLISLAEERLLSHLSSTADLSNLWITIIPGPLFTKTLLTRLLFILYLKR